MGDLGSITVAPDRMGKGRVTGLEAWASDAKWDGKPLLVDWLPRMCDGLPYGAHGGHRLRRGAWEKELMEDPRSS